ncbi:MAG: alpha-2-macroglobulin family protein [Bryobacteraceae bacterium]
MRRRFLLSLALLTLLPSVAQEQRPYFSLSSGKTWAPGEAPSIQMWANNVSGLEFRVYRVNDPIKFFQKLENVHRFGEGEAPATKGEPTWIERFHSFKGRWRTRVRDAFREQFSADSRQTIRTWSARREQQPLPNVAQYATGVPLLNPRQVVAVWKQPISTKRRWESQVVPINVTEKGLYLVEAVHSDLRAYTVVLITDLAVITKSAPGVILAYAANRQSGEPVRDCPLYVWSKKQEVARPTTNQDGLAETRLQDPDPGETLVLARKGDDFAISNLYAWNLGQDPGHFSTGYVYTDRPIYRPGHTVYWKGIQRKQTASGYQLPAGRQARVEINDPEGNTVFRKDVTFSAMGTVSGEFAVPREAALGYYSLQIFQGEFPQAAGFQVEEYKKPEYEVRVTAEKARVLQGEEIAASISARYFFGEPVKGAKVTYVVHRQRYWFPLYAEDPEDGGAEGDDNYYGEREQILEQQGQLDENGKLTVRIPTVVSEKNQDMRYRVEARVTDASNREISGAAGVIATHGSFLVHVQPVQYVYSQGEKAVFQIETRNYDGNPVQAQVKVTLRREQWRERTRSETGSAETRTDANGQATVSFSVTEGGSYSALAVAHTPEGRDVQDSAWLWVTAPGGAWWTGGSQQRITLVPDKKTYKPGDVAKVLVVNGVAGARVLITAEGQQLYTRQVLKADGAAITVNVPIRPEYAPNFYVSAVFVKDNQVFQGTKKVTVPAAAKALQLEVEPSKKEYKPGEAAVYRVTAKDPQGQAVPGAEISLGVVDEAIYAIRPDAAGDIFKAFYGTAPNRVNTQSSLSYYFQGEAGKRTMPLAQFRRASLAQLKPETLIRPKVRKAFPDTIYWTPALITDAAGKAEARFQFPDSLTTWRATARGITRDTMAGAAINKTIVRKNLMLRLSTPRFLTKGDDVTISVLVHNYLKNDKTARVSLEVEGVEMLEGATRDVPVAAGADVKLDWRLRAYSIGEAKLTGKALTDEESDAMEITLPVKPFGVRLSMAKNGSVDAPSGEAAADLAFPTEIDPASRTLEVSLSPSIAGTIFGALEYLTSFPYGCTEQTMSSFLPNVIVSQTLKELNIPAKVDAADLLKKTRAGLDRLYDFQHEDGGWGWWHDDPSHPFMSAYVVSGIAQAKAAGYPVRDEVLERGRTWLKQQLEPKVELHPDLRAYVAYAIGASGAVDAKGLDLAWSKRGDMTSYGTALIGHAFAAAGDSRLAETLSLVESKAKSDEQDAFWPVDQDHLMGFHGDTTTEATAFALKLLVRHKAASPLIAKAAHWLASHRDEGYYWRSTKQTAMVVYGLTDYLRASGELQPNFAITVSLNGKQVLTRRFTAQDALKPDSAPLRFPSAELAPGGNRVRITKTGEGRLYWSARGDYYSTEAKLARTGSVALNISREYFRLVPEQQGEKIVHRLEPLGGTVSLAPGDVLAVRLQLSGGDWSYLLIEDPIPAGTESIEKDDLYTLKERPAWWQWIYSRREFRDDRVALFQNYFTRRGLDQFHLLKVVNPGKFRVNPARVQPMYQPQYLATTESREVEVR